MSKSSLNREKAFGVRLGYWHLSWLFMRRIRGQPSTQDIWFLHRRKEEMGAVNWVYRDGDIRLFRTLCQPDSPLQYKLRKGGAERLLLLLLIKPDCTCNTNWRQLMVIRYLGFHQATISRAIKWVEGDKAKSYDCKTWPRSCSTPDSDFESRKLRSFLSGWQSQLQRKSESGRNPGF